MQSLCGLQGPWSRGGATYTMPQLSRILQIGLGTRSPLRRALDVLAESYQLPRTEKVIHRGWQWEAALLCARNDVFLVPLKDDRSETEERDQRLEVHGGKAGPSGGTEISHECTRLKASRAQEDGPDGSCKSCDRGGMIRGASCDMKASMLQREPVLF